MRTTSKSLNDVCEFVVDCLHATAPIQEDGYALIRTPNIGRGRLLASPVGHCYSQDCKKLRFSSFTLSPNPGWSDADSIPSMHESPSAVEEAERVCATQVVRRISAGVEWPRCASTASPISVLLVVIG